MSLRVDTGALRGYAGQLRGTHDGALRRIERYLHDECADRSGLDGLLVAARAPLGLAVDLHLDVLDATRRGLWGVQERLVLAADAYDRADADAATRLVLAGGRAPAGHREHDVPGAAAWFGTGAEPALDPPPRTEEAAGVRERIHAALHAVNGPVKALTGHDLLAAVLPLVIGEWGDVRRIGSAWGAVEQAYTAVARDVGAGMDTLSTRWDTPGEGGAAAAFDHQIRRSWIPCLEAVAQACDAVQQGCEVLAEAYAYIVGSLAFVLTLSSARLVSAITGAGTAAATGAFLAEAWYVGLLVAALWRIVSDAVELALDQLRVFAEIVEQAVATVVLVRNHLRGDWAALEPARPRAVAALP